MFNHLFYDITFLPTALGAQWVVVWLSHLFLQVLLLLSRNLLALAPSFAFLFLSSLSFLPPSNLASPPSYTSF